MQKVATMQQQGWKPEHDSAEIYAYRTQPSLVRNRNSYREGVIVSRVFCTGTARH